MRPDRRARPPPHLPSLSRCGGRSDPLPLPPSCFGPTRSTRSWWLERDSRLPPRQKNLAGCRPHPHGKKRKEGERKKKEEGRGARSEEQNHSTQDSHVVPHHGTNWAALRLTAQIGRDAVLSESYGRGCLYSVPQPILPSLREGGRPSKSARCPQGSRSLERGPALKWRANKRKKEKSPIRKGSNKSLEQGLNLSGS